MYTDVIFFTRGIHYFYSYVIYHVAHSVTVTSLVDTILYTSHMYTHGACTAAKCDPSTAVTRNGTLLLILLFFCLYIRDILLL